MRGFGRTIPQHDEKEPNKFKSLSLNYQQNRLEQSVKADCNLFYYKVLILIPSSILTLTSNDKALK